MKLSMSMLAWYLKDFHPKFFKVNDEQIIKGIRFLMNRQLSYHQEYVYFGNANQFFADPQYDHAFIVVHKKSYLMFEQCDYEELLNDLISAFDYFNDWESRMLEGALSNAPLEELLKIGQEVIENPLVITSVDGDVYYSGDAPDGDPYWNYNILTGTVHPAIADSVLVSVDGEVLSDIPRSPKAVINVYPGGAPVIMGRIIQDGETVAHTGILLKDRSLTDMNCHMAEVIARILENTARLSLENCGIQSNEKMIKDILGGMAPTADVIRKLENSNFSLPCRVMYICHPTRGDQLRSRMLLHALRNIPIIEIAFPYEDGIVALLREQGYLEMYQKKISKLEPFPECCVGVSMITLSWEHLARNCHQALWVTAWSNKSPGIYKCEDHAFRYLIQNMRNQDMTMDMLHPAVNILKQYDLDNGTDLYHTVSVYLDNEMNLVKTAEALYIHRNTMKYRIRRVEEIAGIDFSDADDKAYLRLSVWLDKRE